MKQLSRVATTVQPARTGTLGASTFGASGRQAALPMGPTTFADPNRRAVGGSTRPVCAALRGDCERGGEWSESMCACAWERDARCLSAAVSMATAASAAVVQGPRCRGGKQAGKQAGQQRHSESPRMAARALWHPGAVTPLHKSARAPASGNSRPPRGSASASPSGVRTSRRPAPRRAPSSTSYVAFGQGPPLARPLAGTPIFICMHSGVGRSLSAQAACSASDANEGTAAPATANPNPNPNPARF